MPLFGHVAGSNLPSPLFHFAAVALTASVVRGRASLDNFPEHVVQRPNEFGRGRVVALLELLYFSGMAPPAIARRNNHGDFVTVMVKCRWIAGSRLVTGITVHTLLRVGAALPLLDDARRRRPMAFEAGFASLGDLRLVGIENRSEAGRGKEEKQPEFPRASWMARTKTLTCTSVSGFYTR